MQVLDKWDELVSFNGIQFDLFTHSTSTSINLKWDNMGRIGEETKGFWIFIFFISNRNVGL